MERSSCKETCFVPSSSHTGDPLVCMQGPSWSSSDSLRCWHVAAGILLIFIATFLSLPINGQQCLIGKMLGSGIDLWSLARQCECWC